MEYHKKLESAATIKEVQGIYNEAFKNMVSEIEVEFISEGNGQQLVYVDGCIDPSLTIADIHLLVYAENRAEKLCKKKREELLIKSNHDSYIEKRLEELQNEEMINRNSIWIIGKFWWMKRA